jgi:hypothetical protein
MIWPMRRAEALMPALMLTWAILDGFIVSTEMKESPYLWAFSDDVVLGEPCNSKLVAGAGKRFESARRLTFSYE